MIRYLRTLYLALPIDLRTRALLRSRVRVLGRYLTWWRKRSKAACLPVTPPLPARSDCRDRLFFGVIDWHYRIQRPQHLATELAGLGHRVFYFSNEFIESAAAGFCAEVLDTEGRLFQIHLQVSGSEAIYFGCPSPSVAVQLREGVRLAREWAGITDAVAIVQHPFWAAIAGAWRDEPLVYDCMDFHEGFDTFADDLRDAEHRLFRDSALTVVTSAWLADMAARYTSRVTIIRNAADYAFFSKPPAARYVDDKGRQVIGYYGALGAWFDADLVKAIAARFEQCLVLLVGGDQCGVGWSLRNCANVELTGEVRYEDLPYYLYGFDVCLLPFKVTPLTMATNPVKMYEYFAAGKPVVAVDIPEARDCEQYLDVASNIDEFCALLSATLNAPDVGADERRRFAEQQTWVHRARELDVALQRISAPG